MVETIPEIEQEIVEEFELFDDWTDKYQYIIELGQKLPTLDDQYKKDENRIKGCQSSVWLNSFEKDGKIYFEAGAVPWSWPSFLKLLDFDLPDLQPEKTRMLIKPIKLNNFVFMDYTLGVKKM